MLLEEIGNCIFTLIPVIKHLTVFMMIGILMITSDSLLEHIGETPWLRVIVDNATHVFLGILCWLLIVVSYFEYTCLNVYGHFLSCLLCGIFAGALDIDHFLCARSLNLADALNLRSRPVFHNTTLMVTCAFYFITVFHVYNFPRLERVAWIFLVAVVSHHLRDASHRGIWLYPYHFKPMDVVCTHVLTYIFTLAIGALVAYFSRNFKMPEYTIV